MSKDFRYAVCNIKCTVFMAGLFGELGHRKTSMGSSFWKRKTSSKLVFLLFLVSFLELYV